MAHLGEYVVTPITETGTGVFQPKRQVDVDGSGNPITKNAQPFGAADRVGYHIEIATTGTVEIRAKSSNTSTAVVLRTVTASELNAIVIPLPYIDFNITANGSGIRISVWGNNSV